MLPYLLIAAGGLGVAATTALEVVTSPYSAYVSAYPINGPVHLLKVAAVLIFAAGMAVFLARFRRRLGVVGSVAAGALGIGPLLGAIPYSLAEASLDPTLTPSRANAELEAIYAAQPWIGEVAGLMLPVIVFPVVAFGIVVLRRRLVPMWARRSRRVGRGRCGA